MNGKEWLEKFAGVLPKYKNKISRIHGASHEVIIGLLSNIWLELNSDCGIKNSPSTCKYPRTVGVDARIGQRKADSGLLFKDSHVGLLEVENSQNDWILTAKNITNHLLSATPKCQESAHQEIKFGILSIWGTQDAGNYKDTADLSKKDLESYLSKAASTNLPVLLVTLDKTGWNGSFGSDKFTGDLEYKIFGA